MRFLLQISVIAAIAAAPCGLPVQLCGQANLLELFPDRKREWKRLSTDEDSTTDISVSSLVLESNGVFRATFRIQLRKPEKAFENAEAKYKTRMMTMQFDSWKNTYRIFETTLLDSSEKVVYASGQRVDAPWKSGSGGSFYNAASHLSPLGLWKVVASSESGTSERINSLTTELDRFQVGRTSCSVPNYESVSMTGDELRKMIGSAAVNGVDVSADKINAIKIKCKSMNPTSEVHILIPKSLDRATLLSGGEIYVLERLG